METSRQKWNIEAQLKSECFRVRFLGCQQIEGQGPKSDFFDLLRDISVSRAPAATPAAMGEKDDAACSARNGEVAFKNHLTARNFDFAESGRRGHRTVGWFHLQEKYPPVMLLTDQSRP